MVVEDFVFVVCRSGSGGVVIEGKRGGGLLRWEGVNCLRGEK